MALRGHRPANGSTFGRYGIEIDAAGPASPPGTIVLARIPDLLGPGKSAEMTYYETPAGREGLQRGSDQLRGHRDARHRCRRCFENLWNRLSTP